MPNGGTLRIAAGEANLHNVPFVFLRVSDTGKGIPHDKLLQIFEPFFTTKEIGHEEPTPLLLIESLLPGVLVKGPDYAGRECCGAKLVESYGGRVVIPDWPVRQSSTRIVDRILSQGAAR